MNEYLIVKSLHLIMIVCWFAGLFYLPRLFGHHHSSEPGSKMYNTFVMMEKKLLWIIMFPAMLATLLLGAILIYINDTVVVSGWFHLKMLLVVLLIIYHYMLFRYQRAFALGKNKHSAKFYRILSETPSVLLIGCVFLAVCKPF